MDDRPPPRQIDLEDRPKRGGFTSRGFNTERPRTFMRDREARAAADKANAPFARREPRLDAGAIHQHHPCAVRSEEHTSELQSLMRISYAVFCLKKKNSIRKQPSP